MNRDIANYSEQLELLSELIGNYEKSLNWCNERHFLPYTNASSRLLCRGA